MWRRAIVLIAFLFAAGAALADTRMVVLLIGPPGAGKTTQAKRISRKYHIPSISMSALLEQDSGGAKPDRRRT